MKGLAFHVHHAIPFEYCHSYDERVKCIKEDKPRKEQGLRLRLLQVIPDELMPGRDSKEYKSYVKRAIAYYKAGAAHNKAADGYRNMRIVKGLMGSYDKEGDTLNRVETACNEARDAYNKEKEAYTNAFDVYIEAEHAYLKKYGEELKSLHDKLCPDCPWDGETIFTRKDKDGNWR